MTPRLQSQNEHSQFFLAAEKDGFINFLISTEFWMLLIPRNLIFNAYGGHFQLITRGAHILEACCQLRAVETPIDYEDKNKTTSRSYHARWGLLVCFSVEADHLVRSDKHVLIFLSTTRWHLVQCIHGWCHDLLHTYKATVRPYRNSSGYFVETSCVVETELLLYFWRPHQIPGNWDSNWQAFYQNKRSRCESAVSESKNWLSAIQFLVFRSEFPWPIPSLAFMLSRWTHFASMELSEIEALQIFKWLLLSIQILALSMSDERCILDHSFFCQASRLCLTTKKAWVTDSVCK